MKADFGLWPVVLVFESSPRLTIIDGPQAKAWGELERLLLRFSLSPHRNQKLASSVV
jgi:hypothetical protein